MNKDLIVGIVGAAILVSAMVGVFRYEAARTSSAVFDVAFDSVTDAGTRTSGSTDEGDETAATVPVERRNVTRIEWVLEWTDDVGGPDVFNVTVTSPDGRTHSAQADGGTVSVAFDDLAVLPPEMRLTGQGEADVRARAEQSYGSQAAIGDWSVVVKLVDAGDQVTPVGNVVVQEDAGNEWTLTPRLTYYEATFTGA